MRGEAMTTSRRGWGAAVRELNRAFEPRSEDPAHLLDAALLARFATTRDDQAFASLVDRHGPMVLALARSIVRSPDDAEDVFQATFLILARRARSIRSGGSLAAWLHQVARHAALRAVKNRRHRERTTGDLAAVDPAAPTDQTHQQAESARLIHEELGRLPARYRSAIVLCDLEAMTRDQAAAALGWPAGTVAGRLARGRQLLRDRLIRRGGDRDAWLGATPRLVPVPPLWALAVVRAATIAPGGVGPVALLAARVSRGMLVASLGKTVFPLVVTLGLVTAVVGWRARSVAPDPVPAAAAAAPRVEAILAPLVVQPPTPPPQVASQVEPVVFRGQVVDPSGLAVPGAKVYRVELTQHPAIPPEPNALTDASGRFEFASTRFTVASGVDEQVVDGYKRGIRLLAVARGFGPGFIRPERSGPLEIALTRDDGPIQGRVVDAAGQPVAGARIKGLEMIVPPLAAGANGGIAGWVTRARAVKDLAEAQTVLTAQFDTALIGPDLASVVQVPATTDAEGRFTIAGLGRDRVLSAVIEGPGIATQVVLLTTERLDAPVTVAPGLRRSEPGRSGFATAVTVYGMAPTIVGRPGRTIAGVIRDADSQQPLAGVTVRLDDSVSPLSPTYLIETVTDAQGQYRLAGIRANSRPRVSARPAADARWLGLLRLLDVEAGVATGNPPVALDFALRRGVWATGRVFDAATGQPRKVEITTFVPLTNPYAFADPSIQLLSQDRVIDSQGHSFTCDADGRFRLLIYPGPGFITAGTNRSTDASGIGSEILAGVPRSSGILPGFATLPEPLVPRYFGTIIKVDPPLGSDALEVSLPIQTTRERTGTVLAADGRPVSSEVMAYNLKPEANGGVPTHGLFTVEDLVPGRLRRVLFRQDDSKQIGLLELRDAAGPPLLVTLHPWGTVKVRIDDQTGQLQEARLRATIIDVGGDPLFQESNPSYKINKTDLTRLAADQYEIQALEPSLGYNIEYQSFNGAPPHVIARDVRVRSGETLDLGTIRVEEKR